MEQLKNKVFLGNKSLILDDNDLEFIFFLIKKYSIDARLIIGIKKIETSLFYTTYQVNIRKNNNEEVSIFINSSFHKNFFSNEKIISKNFNSLKKWSTSPEILGKGMYLDNIEYIIYCSHKSYSFNNILTDNIPLFSRQLGFCLNHFHENLKSFKGKKIQTMKDCAKSFFEISSFHKYENKNIINSFLKKYRGINKDIFFSFHEDSSKFFENEVLSKLSFKENIVCTGFKLPQDIIVLADFYLPNFINNSSIYRGDPALDFLFYSQILNIDEIEFNNSIKKLNPQAFDRYKELYDSSWIIRMNYTYFNKLVREFYSKSAHNFSLIYAEQIYYENRLRMKNSEIFSKYIDSFNDFFIEK